MKENYIPQPLQQRMDALRELQKTVGIDIGDRNIVRLDQPMNWPRQGTTPLSDFKSPGIQSKAFPLLFPTGDGDATFGDRPIKVKLKDANKHLLWYAVPLKDDNGNFGGFFLPICSPPSLVLLVSEYA